MKRLICLATVLLMFLLVISGCSNAGSTTIATTSSTKTDTTTATTITTNETTTTNNQKVIAYSTMGFDSPYWVEIANGIEDAAKDKGWIAKIHDAKGSAESQISAMETWVNEKVDFIILSSIDAAALAPSVDKAMAAGIPVIGQSTITPGQILREGPDQADMGNALGKAAGIWAKNNWAADFKAKGVTYFVQADPATIVRENAMRASFEAEFPNIEWINEPGTIDSLTLEDGINNFTGLIQSNPDINVVLSCCDDGLVGSYEVAKSNNMDMKKMIFGGINALPQVLEEMMKAKKAGNGGYRVTVDTGAYMCGRECVEVIAQKYFNGEKLEDAYWVPATAVTYDNIDSYFDENGKLSFGSEAYRAKHYK